MKSVLSTFILAICSLFIACKSKKKAEQIVPEVSVVIVGQRSLPIYTEYVGQALGQADVEIRPRVEGWVQGIHFKEGGPVNKGQLLYTIQDDELRDRVQMAQARLAEENVMLVKAKADLDRVRPLAEMRALSLRDLDAAVATYRAQKEAVISARALLNNARTQLSYSRIRAPISGTIGISKVQVGDYVNKGMAQQPINIISSLGRMRIRFSISESDYIKYKQKMTPAQARNVAVQFVLNDGSIFPETGRIDFANREIDPTTGSLMLQAVVANRTRLLRPGQYVKVRFIKEEITNAVVVPQQAINQMQNIYMTYVVGDSNKIVPRPVKTGERIGANWVVTEGLNPGEKVALIGNALIKPGTVVKPVIVPYPSDTATTGR